MIFIRSRASCIEMNADALLIYHDKTTNVNARIAYRKIYTRKEKIWIQVGR